MNWSGLQNMEQEKRQVEQGGAGSQEDPPEYLD